MAYQFTKRPVTTGKTIQEIGSVVNEIGQEPRFVMAFFWFKGSAGHHPPDPD